MVAKNQVKAKKSYNRGSRGKERERGSQDTEWRKNSTAHLVANERDRIGFSPSTTSPHPNLRKGNPATGQRPARCFIKKDGKRKDTGGRKVRLLHLNGSDYKEKRARVRLQERGRQKQALFMGKCKKGDEYKHPGTAPTRQKGGDR